MQDVQQLLSEYIAEHRAGGEADPLAFLDRLEGAQRTELAALIDGYLARAPRRSFDAEAFGASSLGPTVEGIARSLEGFSGLWPSLLPGLRERAQLKRSDLVERLTRALGFAGREAKVARYYHEMELGSLPSEGVSDRVLEALGAIVGVSATALRSAGRAVGAEPSAAAPSVFARAVPSFEDIEAGPQTRAPSAPWDEIDELFRGPWAGTGSRAD